ncbi:MAG: stage III sporulation protein AA, partial [[Clostridium] symbiosum]
MENKDRLFQIFSKKLRGVLGTLDVEPEGIEEIRMRIGAPLFIIYKNREYTVTAEGTLKEPPGIWKK